MSNRGRARRQRDPVTGKLYRVLGPARRLGAPPKALRRRQVHFDNVALVPASMLPSRAQWQQLANGLPAGGVLICLPTGSTAQRRTLEAVADFLRARGRVVRTLPASELQ